MHSRPLSEFVTQLWETGAVRVPEFTEDARFDFHSDDLAESELRLVEFEREARSALPGSPPRVEPEIALEGLIAVFIGCGLLVHRRLLVSSFERIWSGLESLPNTPETVYALDLTLRYLPDLHRFATILAEHDPLCSTLERLGRCWPLSSVGLKFRDGHAPSAAELAERSRPWWTHDSLRRLYLDRISEREDLSRLADPIVATAMRGVLGGYAALSPALSTAVGTSDAGNVIPTQSIGIERP